MNHTVSLLHRGIGLRFCMAALVALGLISSAYIQPVLQTVQQAGRFRQGYHNELIICAISSDALSAFIPALAAIPLSAEYLEDIKNKVSRLFLIRGSYSNYLLGHCFACWLCGGSSVLLGALTAWGITTTIFLPLERLVDNPPELRLQIIERLVLLFLNGGLWAVLGMTMSTIMESKYIAYASPFIVYYLLVILYERYFPEAGLLSPKNWLDLKTWPYGLGSAILFLLELTFLCGLIFYIRGKRRLEAL